MRDKNRIAPMCALLQQTWERQPDLRFGQLLYNMSYAICREKQIPDMYNIEDDEMFALLQAYCKGHRNDGIEAGNE